MTTDEVFLLVILATTVLVQATSSAWWDSRGTLRQQWVRALRRREFWTAGLVTLAIVLLVL